MGVSYKKLFKLLIDRGMKKKDLQEAAKLSPAAVTKLAKGEYVRLDVLVRVCCALEVDTATSWRSFMISPVFMDTKRCIIIPRRL